MTFFAQRMVQGNRPRLSLWLLTCICLCFAVTAMGNDPVKPVKTTLSIMQGDLELRSCMGEDDSSYDWIRFDDCSFLQPAGWPMIPAKIIRLAVPEGQEAIGIRTVVKSEQVLEGTFRLHPTQKATPMSRPDSAVFIGPDPEAYDRDEYLPGRTAELIDQGSLSGYNIAEIVVYPVQWNPSTGRVVLSEIEVTLDTVASKAPNKVRTRTVRGERLHRERVQSLVCNPEQVPEKACDQVVASFEGKNDIVEYLIVTTPAYEAIFRTLADWKKKKGLPSEVVTTDWVYANYGGALDDDATRIRECIKDYWQNKGLIYVLLGGDTHYDLPPEIPDRRGFAMPDDKGDEIPTDMYFADLDGTWDDDGDGIYGEYPDDNIDMYCDIYVGRASVATTDEATLFVTKVLQYEGEGTQTPINPDWTTEMFFMASLLDEDADGKVVKQAIISESVPAQFDPITELYESDGNLSPNTAKDALHAGNNIVNHIGHGNATLIETGTGTIKNQAIYALTNAPDYSVMYTVSCYTGNYVRADCFGEKFMLAPEGGGFFIGASRYSWYSTPDFDNTLSNRQDRDFFKTLFLPQTNYYPLGMVNSEAKHLRVGDAKLHDIERYLQYAVNVLGDPEMPVWKNTPKQFNAFHYKALDLSGSPLDVTVKHAGAPIEGAVVCLWKDDEVYLVETTDATGQVTLLPAPATTGSMFITITKPDFQPYENIINVLESTLSADADTLSAATGGAVNFTLTAGEGYGNRSYFLLGTSSGTNPGTGLPGGWATLPLNWDLVTDLILQLVNTPVFLDFAGTLDGTGQATAQFNTYGPLPSSYIGLELDFAYTFYNPFDMASNSVPVEILP